MTVEALISYLDFYYLRTGHGADIVTFRAPEWSGSKNYIDKEIDYAVLGEKPHTIRLQHNNGI